MILEIIERKELLTIPSASGMVKTDKTFYVIGDNSPFLFKLNLDFSIIKQIALVNHENLLNEIFCKKDKSDFEAIALWKQSEEKKLFIFGSGSKSPERDILVMVDLVTEDTPLEYSLNQFYAQLRHSAKIAPENFNIEAATIAEEQLLLFNRGNNMIFSFGVEDFYRALNSGTEFPPANIYLIQLPVIKGIQAGFSAASYISSTGQILFTATLENTSNWIDDGEVLGSYLGFLNFKNLQNHPKPHLVAITQTNLVQAIKVEGIAANQTEENIMEVIMVTDSDGATSEVLKGRLLY